MDETRRSRIYEQSPTRPYERAERLPQVSTGSVVAMVLGTLLLAMLAVWAIAQADGFALFSSAGLERHFCRSITC